MSEVERVSAYSFEVRLGRAVTEPVSEARLKLHQWLANRLKLTASSCEPIAAGTSDVSFEDLSRHPQRIEDALRPHVAVADDGVITVDLSMNTYDLLGERFLLRLGQTVADLAAPGRTVVLLLPGHPPRQTSLLWVALAGILPTHSGRVLVIDRLGELRAFGGSELRMSEKLIEEIRERQASLAGTTDDRFHAKLLRRLGHFNMAAIGGERECGRYFFDCSFAKEELADILDRKLRARYSKRKLSESTIVLCAARSGWMEDAARMVAERYGMPCEVLPRGATVRHRRRLSAVRNIVVFDVVSSGATLEWALTRLRTWNVPLGDYGITALTTDRQRLRLASLKVDFVAEVRQQTVPSEDCSQCQAEIAFSSFELEEPHVMFSAFDMWTMLLDVAWGSEPYWPADKRKLEYIPDFAQAFDNYGDWIAYRYDVLLTNLRYTRDVVVVSPDEPRVQRLLDRLRARFEERLVAVAIERNTIDAISTGQLLADRVAQDAVAAARDADDWRRQLLHLRASSTPVVIIDEFNASGGSARAMVELLRAFGVPVTAYLPFLDWHPGLDLQATRVHALYEIPSPRVR